MTGTAPSAPPRAVLVTGGASTLGTAVVAALARDWSIRRIASVDVLAPSAPLLRALGRAEYVRADLASSTVAALLAAGTFDTVVHVGERLPVLGTTHLLALCQRSASVRRLVVTSSAAVYGSGPHDPALFTEEMELRSGSRPGPAIEVESVVGGFARRRPDVAVTTLRLAELLGPSTRTFLSDYFALPVAPTVLGRDARIQLLHLEDAVAVTVLATAVDVGGTFNVGGAGIIMLSQALRRAGRIALPVPGPLLRALAPSRGLRGLSPEKVDYLSHGRAVDSTRARETLGFRPSWTTLATFDDYAQAHGVRPWGKQLSGLAQ